jgi:HAD superfamily hydrolase (TIGR01509 family)
MRYRAILFDLFRTVILFTPMAPTGKVRESTWRTAMQVLAPRFSELLPDVGFEDFLDALIAATEAIAHSRPPEYLEVPIAERYRRGLALLGHDGPHAAAIAAELAGLQLAAQSANAVLPPEHRTLLESLARDRPIGLVSNFDDGPMVRALLAREGLDRLFSAIVVSMELGRRKPHPAIFLEALRLLDARPEEALFVGDSLGADVGGARGVGIDAVWVNRTGKPMPSGAAMPSHVIAELGELEAIVRTAR